MEQNKTGIEWKGKWKRSPFPPRLVFIAILALSPLLLPIGLAYRFLLSLLLFAVLLVCSVRFGGGVLNVLNDVDRIRKIKLENKLFASLITIGVIDENTKRTDLVVKVLEVDPPTFQITSRVIGLSVDNLESIIEKIKPKFSSIRYSCEVIDGVAVVVFYPKILSESKIYHAPELSPSDRETGLIPIGINLLTGETVKIATVQNNLLIGAMTRAGKSNLMRGMISYALEMDCVKVSVIDTKQVDFIDYKNEVDNYIDTLDGAREFLTLLVGEMNLRYKLIKAGEVVKFEKTTSLKPTPLHIVFIDELATLLNSPDKQANKKVLNCLNTLNASGLASGISLIVATQKPSGDSLGQGSTTFRDNFTQRLAFRTSNPAHTETIGDFQPFNPEKFPATEDTKGIFAVNSALYPQTVYGKAFINQPRPPVEGAWPWL